MPAAFSALFTAGATLDADVALEVVPEGAAPGALSGGGTGVSEGLTVASLRVSTGGTGVVGMAGVAGFAPEGLSEDASLFSRSDRMDLILSKIPMMDLPLFVNSFTAIVL